MSENEWDDAAKIYNSLFKPRFLALYKKIANLVSDSHARRILDFACGPGEPSGTILENCDIDHIYSADSSAGMISICENLKSSKCTPILWQNVHASDFAPLDCITCSLGLMYVEDVDSLLSEFHSALSDSGVLIGSCWPHVSTVPFLKILKQVAREIKNEPCSLEYYETQDATFSWWNVDHVRKILAKSGFNLVQWNIIDLPMEFDSPEQVVQFHSSDQDWYQANLEQIKAKAAVLVEEELGYAPKEKFTMLSKGVVFYANKL